MDVVAPFDISVQDPKPDLRELHFSFTADFQKMAVAERLEALRAYIKSLVKQAETLVDPESQRGIVTVIQISEEIFPHIQSDNLPLDEVLIVEIGGAAEGSSLDELLGNKLLN